MNITIFKNKFRKKIFFLLFTFIFTIPLFTQANQIILLEDYSGLGNISTEVEKIESSIGNNPSQALASYINIIVNLAFGFVSIFAVFLIIKGGLYYVSNSFFKKTEGKDIIFRAISGIVILALSWYFLKEANPSLIEARFSNFSISGTASSNASLTDTNNDPETPEDRWCYLNDDHNTLIGGYEKRCMTKEECIDEQSFFNTQTDTNGLVRISGCYLRFGTDAKEQMRQNNTNRYCMYAKGRDDYVFADRSQKIYCYNSIGECLAEKYERGRGWLDVTTGFTCKDMLNLELRSEQEVVVDAIRDKINAYHEQGAQRIDVKFVEDENCVFGALRNCEYDSTLEGCKEAVREHGGIEGSCVPVSMERSRRLGQDISWAFYKR